VKEDGPGRIGLKATQSLGMKAMQERIPKNGIGLKAGLYLLAIGILKSGKRQLHGD